MSQQRIGILGGTFNPIHFGHLAASEEVRERLKLDCIMFIPSFLPPHKREEEVPSASRRLEMVRRAISGNAHFALSDIEVKRGGKSYTIDTIEEVHSAHPNAQFFFITGVDSFLEIRTWKRWEELLSLCSFVILSRPGYCFSDLLKIDFMNDAASEVIALDRGDVRQAFLRIGPFTLYLETISHFEISSTDIRKRIRKGRSIKYLLPETVEHYIINNKLYA